LQDCSIPSPLLNFGKRGQIMKKLGLKYVVPKDYSKLINPKTGNFEIKNIISIDSSLLKYREAWTNPKKISPKKVPSSIIMDPKIISKGIPLLSVVIDNDDLYDDATGIFTNYYKKGRNWERPCFVSYYEEGKLLFATGAGVRVHGGRSRKKKNKSIKLYFRDIYGFDEFKRGILFNKGSEPLSHLIVRNDTRGGIHYLSPLCYDISKKIGCITPETHPVMFYLNGSHHGMEEKIILDGEHHGWGIQFSLTEHLSKEYLISHYGHDNFIFIRSKNKKKQIHYEYKEMIRWAKNWDGRMTMEEATKRIDIQNLSYWWISQLFLSNNDIYQGLAILDKSKPDSKWFWINWDMDHCIRNSFSQNIKNIWEQELTFYNIVKSRYPKNEPRAILFNRLRNESPQFVKYFNRLTIDTLNHKVTHNFLKSIVDKYKEIAILLGVDNLYYLSRVRLFFKHRPKFMMKLMQKYFNSPKTYYCQVKGPDDIIYEIDGFITRSEYKGIYFKNYLIKIKIVNDYREKLLHWIINGKKIRSPNNILAFPINSETIIKPVFSN